MRAMTHPFPKISFESHFAFSSLAARFASTWFALPSRDNNDKNRIRNNSELIMILHNNGLVDHFPTLA